MSLANWKAQLQAELERLDSSGGSKRAERVIESFTPDTPPKAVIGSQAYDIFNSNDYLGLRFHPALKKGEEEASKVFGAGPGAVRFISGSLKVHRDLEKAIAAFHGRDDAMVFSSAFATNVAVLSSLIKGQSKDSLVSANTLVVSDELNHRSIIEGIRAASIPSEHKAIFAHMDASDLNRVLTDNKGKFDRVVVVTDGVFSMLGEYQDLAALRSVISRHQDAYDQGVVLVVDDAHGVGCFGETGRGVEEVCNAKADVLVGTMGKAFGADGGYVTGDQVVIDYLRESAATYIYSNSISPGTAGAALSAFKLFESGEGAKLLAASQANIKTFQEAVAKAGIELAAPSNHPIQPVLVGDPLKSKALAKALFEAGYMVTPINYPVVPKGRDEIRVQISAAHTSELIEKFVKIVTKSIESI
jgi:glycine C-acetyltransferase